MKAKISTRKATPPTTRLAHKAAPDASTSRTRPRSVAGATQTAKRLAKRAIKVANSAPVARSGDLDSPGISKQAQLIALLSKAAGATLTQMMELTGWQAHTVRGTLSGVLRKRLGLNVTCNPTPGSGERIYRIVGATASA